MKLGNFFKSSEDSVIHFSEKESRKGRGFSHKGNLYIHHSDLDHEETAFRTLISRQKLYIALLLILVFIFLALNWHATLAWVFGILTVLYFCDLLFNLFLIIQSFRFSPEIKIKSDELKKLKPRELPLYTIFCPLYKEWQVVEQFSAAIEKLDYPKGKLQVMLILEEDDIETIKKVKSMNLPQHFETLVVPHSRPKTKPKAMNYALKFARGEYLVIFDAEDVPEPNQLKKAFAAFKRLPADVVCVQAKLNFYNSKQNILTRVFTAEYSLWFDLVLTGLQSVGAPIPLGGTSNHFKTADIRTLKGWDAFNVTEDCDLGMRLFKRGFRTAIVDSTTYEEANSHFGNWYRQRSRWIKGYIQTYLVHMRRPKEFMRKGAPHHAFIFQLVIGGKILSMFVNPFMWAVTIAYFLFRSHVGLFIESFFPAPILYIGVFTFIFGNFLYLYYYMIGCAKRGLNDIIKYAYLVPFYWLMMSVAAWQALYEIVAKPHYWAKTVHGLHLNPKEKVSFKDETPKFSNTISLEGKEFGAATEVPDVAAPTSPVSTSFFSRFVSVIKKRLLTGAAFFVAANLFSNFLNFAFNAFLGRELALESFGVLTLMNTIIYLLSIAAGAYGTVLNRQTAFLEAKNKKEKALFFLKQSNRYALFITGALSILWLVASPYLSAFFNIDNILIILLFSPIISILFLSAANKGYLQGGFQFGVGALLVLAESIAKFIFAVAFVYAGMEQFVALSLPLSIAFAYVISVLIISKVTMKSAPDVSKPPPSYVFPSGFYAASLVAGLSTAAFLSVDVLLVKHFMSPQEAGEYSLLSLVGKMVFFFGSLLNFAIIPFTAHDQAQQKNPGRRFFKIVLGMLFLVGGSFVGLGLFGRLLVPLFFGAKATAIVSYLLSYSFSISFFTISNTFVTYHLARKDYRFSMVALLSAVFLSVGIVYSHSSIGSVVDLLFMVSLGNLVVISLMHTWQSFGRFVIKNIYDLLDVIRPLPAMIPSVEGGKRILIFNWRDTKHALAGGAEVYIHELAKRWVGAGNAVVQFCGNDGKSERNDVVDGVRIIRRGGFYFVFPWAFVYYMFKFRGKFDIIVDCHNGLPFFTPLYAKEPVFCLLHHVHQEVFKKYLNPLLGFIASNLESKVMPVVYRNIKFITISNSSFNEMKEWNLTGKGVDILFPGVNLGNLAPGQNHETPVILYLGRLKAYKSVDVLIRAFKQVLDKSPESVLCIAGDGEEQVKLEKLVEILEIEESVVFTGRVTEEEKLMLLQKAWVFVNPSMMEGWGITTIEANACGVPVVAADVPGLRDSVRHLTTGYLVEHGNTDEFATKIVELIHDHESRKKMSESSIEWAKQFDWDLVAQKSLTLFI